jgi:hypothetical protein
VDERGGRDDSDKQRQHTVLFGIAAGRQIVPQFKKKASAKLSYVLTRLPFVPV